MNEQINEIMDLADGLDLNMAIDLAEARQWNQKKYLNQCLTSLVQDYGQRLPFHNLQFMFGYNPAWTPTDNGWVCHGVIRGKI